MSVELLRAYKRQNPRKYALKYGDRTPEEASELLKPSSPFLTGVVKVEIVGTKDIEVDFKEPESSVEVRLATQEEAEDTGEPSVEGSFVVTEKEDGTTETVANVQKKTRKAK